MDKQTDVVVEECVCQGPSQSPARVILLWGETPPNDELMAMFYDTRLLHFQAPRAPRFLLIDRKGRAALGIGGYVKATASYDFDGSFAATAAHFSESSGSKVAPCPSGIGNTVL